MDKDTDQDPTVTVEENGTSVPAEIKKATDAARDFADNGRILGIVPINGTARAREIFERFHHPDSRLRHIRDAKRFGD